MLTVTDFQILDIVRSTLNTTKAFVADITFRDGSIITDYIVYVPEDTSDTQLQAVFNNLVHAAENGELGNFTIDVTDFGHCKSASVTFDF